ncbi:hypothetical protein PAXINDRAFT_20953 [Paxillus involutus ATCC 200175]|uniref:Uncharacterized protein n=1 Tax=Paxillus involutus ATCC 200175 TaxID=664439 RepID=A0A0C9T2T4_PAXIN|nr:hypothetical protein PAXINDRAFT_20953 [Paxillus involutus ATCC 200175]
MPVGTSHGLLNKSNGGRDRKGVERDKVEDKKGEWASGVVAPSSNDDGGDEDVRHAYVVPTSTPTPPTTSHHLQTNDDHPRAWHSRGSKMVSYRAATLTQWPHTSELHDTNRQPWEEAKDETRGDEEGQETREGGRSRTRGPVRLTMATNANEHDQHTSGDEDHSPRPSPQPPPPAFHPPAPTPTPPHPE